MSLKSNLTFVPKLFPTINEVQELLSFQGFLKSLGSSSPIFRITLSNVKKNKVEMTACRQFSTLFFFYATKVARMRIPEGNSNRRNFRLLNVKRKMRSPRHRVASSVGSKSTSPHFPLFLTINRCFLSHGKKILIHFM